MTSFEIDDPPMKHLYFCATDECDDGMGLLCVADTAKEARQWARNEFGFNEWTSSTARRLDQDVSHLPYGGVDGRMGLKLGGYSWIEAACDRCKKYSYMTDENFAGDMLICNDCLKTSPKD